MKNKKMLLSLFALLSLSACAISEDNVYDRNAYSSSIYSENYYKIKEESITKNIIKTNNIELDKDKDFVFTNYDELKAFGESFDKDVYNGTVKYDTAVHSNFNTDFGTIKGLGAIDDSFNHGMLSKLADGLMFCDGRTFQGVRVQIDQEGFIHEYKKKCLGADYFALSFKSGSDYTNENYTYAAAYNIRLHIKLYIEENGKFIENICSYTLNDNVRGTYYLFGFKLTENLSKNLKGIGISYDLLDSTEDASIEHCLLLYETMFVNSSWR